MYVLITDKLIFFEHSAKAGAKCMRIYATSLYTDENSLLVLYDNYVYLHFVYCLQAGSVCLEKDKSTRKSPEMYN